MNNEVIKEFEGKTYHFKLKSKKLVDLEKLTGNTIMDLLHEISFTNVSKIIKYSCLEECDEYDILDKLLEEMSLEEVVTKFILEICKVSGIISEKDLNRINEQIEERNADPKN